MNFSSGNSTTINFATGDQQDDTGIELTPLIDVVFLLLIFFMVSTTFSKETALSIRLPEAQGDSSTLLPNMIEVQVSATAEYAIVNGINNAPQTLLNSNREALLNAMTEFSSDQSMVLVIRADQQASHASIMRVLDVAQELGLSNITFATAQIQEQSNNHTNE